MYDWPQTLAADRSVYALWPLAAGCHHIYIYTITITITIVLTRQMRFQVEEVGDEN